MSDTEKIVVDKLLYQGGFGFFIRWTAREYNATAEVFKIESIDDEGAEYFAPKDGDRDLVAGIDNAKPDFHGTVKWDGCSDMFYEYAHHCGPDSVKAYCELLRFIHLRAQELIPRPDPYSWPEGQDILTIVA